MLKQFKKVSSDLKTILMTDLADLRFLELSGRRNMSINLTYYLKEDHRSYIRNLCSCEKKA